MYHSLEVRVPFCDHRIAEYLYSVPWEYKNYNGMEKGLLRYAVTGLLPEKILHRKKSPYPKTFDPRYEQIMESRMHRLFEEKESPLFHIIRRQQTETLLSGQMQCPWYGQLMRRPQTMAFLLQMDLWLRHYHVQLDF